VINFQDDTNTQFQEKGQQGIAASGWLRQWLPGSSDKEALGGRSPDLHQS
jgi:hypothetical protein